MTNKLLLLPLFLLATCHVSAADIWVSPSGNDNAEGTKGQPLATLTQALRTARENKRHGKTPATESTTIHLTSGTYQLTEPVFIRNTDENILIQGEGNISLSGGVRISGWKKQGKLWVAQVPDFNGRPLDFRQMWVNGVKADRARDVKDFEQMYRILSVDKQQRRLWVPKRAVQKILKGAPYAEMVLHEMWCVANLRIKKIDIDGDSAAISFHEPESRIQFEHPWPCPMVTTDGHNSAFYLTNAKTLLDEPGEWYHDIRTGTVYYMPRKGENMATANIVVPALETLVEVVGTSDEHVKNIQFANITFEHTTWMRPSLKGHVPLQAGMFLTDAYKIRPQVSRPNGDHKLDNQGWLERADAGIEISYADDISFEQCTFQHMGGSGVDYLFACQGGKVNSSSFSDIAMNAYVAGSFSPRGYETHQAYNPLDRREVCSYQTVENSSFTDIGNEDWGCVAIAAGFVYGINILHNEISEVPYTGISIGWGWTRQPGCMGNNRIIGNHIWHYGMHMFDTAGIYTLGSQPNSYVQYNAVHSIYHPSYAHDPNHWFYLYTDEGSSGITVRDNWTEAEKFLKNANGPGNTWENNGPAVADSIKTNAGIQNKLP